MPRPFLEATWRDVIGFSYAVEPARLAPFLPRGAAIDELDGAARVSVVAFEFADTRLLGRRVWGHVGFPEVNLRFYVRYRDERAVVFIRELVPRSAVAAVARLRYGEPYRRIPMRCGRLPSQGGLRVWHELGHGARWRMTVDARCVSHPPQEGTAEHWLTHHALGVGRMRDGRTRVYRVEHPLWALHPLVDWELDVEFGALYGAEWTWLDDAEPTHVTLASGSPVIVYPPRTDGR
jgi:uncharacterized protein YqjF (DUF2071 family)